MVWGGGHLVFRESLAPWFPEAHRKAGELPRCSGEKGVSGQLEDSTNGFAAVSPFEVNGWHQSLLTISGWSGPVPSA